MKRAKKRKKTRKKAILIAAAAIALCAALVVGGLIVYGKAQMRKIPGMSFRQVLEYTTRDCSDTVITVGILRDGEASFAVYGEDGRELPQAAHTYEIGSLTKTFTAALIQRAVAEGKIRLDATLDAYLALPEGRDYPTIEALLTHTAGYKGYYFESPMIGNFLNGRNSFCGVGRDRILAKAGRAGREGAGFEYSNYGYAVLGLVLEAVYGEDYTALVEDFAQNELGLGGTRVSDGQGDLGRYWDWREDDGYIPAGALTSNIGDMLRYARMQAEGDPRFAACHEGLKAIDASNADYQIMGIRMDGIGMAWIIDEENGIVWHNGGTGHYNSYLGFRPETGTAVVILSNLAPGYRIPATVMGIKLLREIDGLDRAD